MWQWIDFCVARRMCDSRRNSGSCRSGLSLIHIQIQNLELRQADILAGPVERGAFDLVTARAVLHHIADPETAIANMIASLREGGALLLIEPDFLPVSVAEPREVRAFWDG
jgi:SAM-dependent methyltransferase